MEGTSQNTGSQSDGPIGGRRMVLRVMVVDWCLSAASCQESKKQHHTQNTYLLVPCTLKTHGDRCTRAWFQCRFGHVYRMWLLFILGLNILISPLNIWWVFLFLEKKNSSVLKIVSQELFSPKVWGWKPLFLTCSYHYSQFLALDAIVKSL